MYIYISDGLGTNRNPGFGKSSNMYCNYFAKNEDNFIIFPLLPDIPKNSISDTQTITTVHT